MSFSCTTVLAHVLLVPILITLLFAPPTYQATGCDQNADYCWDCSTAGNYSSGSAYEENLNSVLLSNISSSGESGENGNFIFRNASSGRTPDEVHAIGLCRGDVNVSSCSSCLKNTSQLLLDKCTTKKEAIMWALICMVRYSDRSIVSVKQEEPRHRVPGNPVAADTNATQFEEALKTLLEKLIKEAATFYHKFAYGGMDASIALPVHALVQCTPDLSESDCGACLNNSALENLKGITGGRVLTPSCTLRFESGEPFYNRVDYSTLTQCSERSDFCWTCYGLPTETNPTSAYTKNLENLLISITSKDNQNPYGFYNVSMGERADRVSVIAMCRGDLTPDDCQSCVKDSSQRLISNDTYCLNKKQAIAWEERCMVRYSNESIFSVRQDEPYKHASNPNQAVKIDAFKLALDPLLSNLSNEAASGDSRRKYASRKTAVEGYDGIHAFAQCTPDLGKQECDGCLKDAASSIRNCCEGAQGVKLLKPSCVLRYEVSKFFGPTTDLLDVVSPPPPPPPPSDGNKRTIIIAVVVSVSVVVLICIFIALKLRKRTNTQVKLPGQYDEVTGVKSLQYDLGTIRAATEDFSENNKLGRGGFGDVYKGKLSNGQLIAVKRHSKTSDQGDKEFKTEVTLVAKLQHRNLVRLLGFCLDKKETLLIYEFVPNSSLDKYVFNASNRPLLDWDKRYKIIRGIARGLLYIHEDSRLRIIHCDLKADNILLDEEMNPKISDFGMARLFSLGETRGNTKNAAGTYGYMAPEYVIQGNFSVKSDVFSFGVLLLEMISGQRNGYFRHNEEDQGHLLTYAWKFWMNGTASTLIDPLMAVGSETDEIMKCIHIGLLCVQENVAERPTMESVVHMLNSRSHDTLVVPEKPGFFMGRSSTQPQNHTPTDYTQASVDEAMITEIFPRP